MSLTTLIQATPGTLPSPYCFTTFQKLLTDFISLSNWQFNSNIGNSFFNYGSSVPTVDNQIYPWFRTGSGFLDGWYYFDGGDWIKANPVAPLSSERKLWVGTEADLVTYDGGDSNAANDRNGPMWEVDHDFDGRIPIGPGTLPGYQTVPVPTVIANGANAGAEGEVLKLTEAQLPAHDHDIGAEASDDPDGTSMNGRFTVSDGTFHWRNTAGAKIGHTRDAGTGADINLSKLPPVRGTFVVKRTSRTFYRV